LTAGSDTDPIIADPDRKAMKLHDRIYPNASDRQELYR